MYSIFDKQSAVNQILKYLGFRENGVFGERARILVRELQRENGLTESGIVDYETFNILLRDYKARQAKALARRTGLNSFPYSFGDSGSDVAVINSYVSDVLMRYSSELPSPREAYFTRDTERAILFLRGVLGLAPSVEVDEEFWVRLMQERAAF